MAYPWRAKPMWIKWGETVKECQNDSYMGGLGLRSQPPSLVQTVNHFTGLYHKFEFFFTKDNSVGQSVRWIFSRNIIEHILKHVLYTFPMRTKFKSLKWQNCTFNHILVVGAPNTSPSYIFWGWKMSEREFSLGSINFEILKNFRTSYW